VDAAHQPLGGPLVVVWDGCQGHLQSAFGLGAGCVRQRKIGARPTSSPSSRLRSRTWT
jgi:hypothetical protein